MSNLALHPPMGLKVTIDSCQTRSGEQKASHAQSHLNIIVSWFRRGRETAEELDPPTWVDVEVDGAESLGSGLGGQP